MKANICDINEYRRKLQGEKGAIKPKVLWVYSASTLVEGVPKSITSPIIVPDGDVQSVIDAIRDFGGVVHEEQGQTIFIPWPPAFFIITDWAPPA